MDIFKQKYGIELPSKELWIFGYGSLMWNPGFEFEQCSTGRLFGHHRSLCLWSVRFRGTEKKPGLVLGLRPGGSCKGMVFKLSNSSRKPNLQYIFNREMITNAYHPVVKSVHLDNGKSVTSLTFVSKTSHPQYAHKMSEPEMLKIIKRASGPRGSNTEYILNTVEHLESIGISDKTLDSIASKLIVN